MNFIRRIIRWYKVKFGPPVGVLIPDPEDLTKEAEREKLPYVEPKDWHFRCPNCGQAHAMVVDEVKQLSIEQTPNGSYAVKVKIITPHATHEATINQDLWHDMLDENLTQPGSLMYCPACAKDAPRWQWNDAYHSAFKYFDMDSDQLCHCGGELFMDQIPGTNRFGLICEKCNWVKPRATVSGDSDPQQK